MDKYNNVVFDIDTSDIIYYDEEFRETCKLHDVDFYDVYYDIICNQIKKNDILIVHSLVRILNLHGICQYNNRLLMYVFLNGSINMFLMIYYIYLFWRNDGDENYNYNYITYNNINKLVEQHKNNICTSILVLSETNLLIKDVINIIMEKQISIDIVDYEEKRCVIDKINNKYDKLDAEWSELVNIRHEDKQEFLALTNNDGDLYNYYTHVGIFIKVLLKHGMDSGFSEE